MLYLRSFKKRRKSFTSSRNEVFGIGLFDRGEPQQVASPDAAMDRYEKELAEETRARIEDMVGFNLRLIEPSRLMDEKTQKTSAYHALLSKDLKISNITVEDVKILRLWFALIDHLRFMCLDETVEVYHAELEAFLALKCSVNGFEREALISTLSKVFKETKTSEVGKRHLI